MGPYTGYVQLGVDLGQRVDPTAVCVIEASQREIEPERWEQPTSPVFTGRDVRHIPARYETVFTVRFLSRLPLNTPYPQIYATIVSLLGNLRSYTERKPRVLVDATDAIAAADSLREALRGKPVQLIAATFTHGDRYVKTGHAPHLTVSVGKAFLVNKLQTLLQWDRLVLPARSPEAAALRDELLNYEIRIDADANDKYGAFRVGSHDDLVTALGLAVLDDPIVEGRRGTVRMLPGL